MKKFRAIVTILAAVVAMTGMSIPKVEASTVDQRNLYQKVFDYNYYAAAYPDVVVKVGNNSQALLEHYINCGAAEGRSASAFFNLTEYAKRYPELVTVFGSNFDAYIQYYVTTGVYQGQNASTVDGELSPEVVANLITRMNSLAGTCTTVYDPTIPRAKNVELAASKLNGVILQPGQSFSYSSTVGPRTYANGFVDAPIYISGKHGVGIGGGICQVSSTLYTAMLNAKITPTERHSHSLPVSYLPTGYDATISGNVLDLKFKNPYDKPLYINSSAANGYLTISLILLQQ